MNNSMASRSLMSDRLLDAQFLAVVIIGLVSVYAVSRALYLLYFHPLSRFPGPRLAAISHVWYAYHWRSGRYPWAIERALSQYGGVVRIAPNELVFFTPQAFQDIYASQKDHMELFIKTDFNDRGEKLAGLIWERNPLRHRELARRLAPAFSVKSMRGMQPILHDHFDYFVTRMRDVGNSSAGVGLAAWTNWLAMDISCDMSWNEKLYQMRDMKSSEYLNVMVGFNFFSTVMQVFRRFPWHSTKHVDFFDHILPKDEPVPEDEQVLYQMGVLSVQFVFAQFSPLSDWLYLTLWLLLEEPDVCLYLTQEIRGSFKSYDNITSDAVTSLPYLYACLEESLRMYPVNCTGLARISPGTTIDGIYVPKGVSVQSSVFALQRSAEHYHYPLHYRPQRWLPHDHPLYDNAFNKDNMKAFFPFSLGPRVCLGDKVAWMQARLFIAKVLWTYDIVNAPGPYPNLEESLHHYGFFDKLERKVRFVPARSDI
ncbi:cytochrome P450 [Xylariomycetidae sp. FL2044]|nr:cytochrome P450 [Xylariomycetidae sp. FL2044]